MILGLARLTGICKFTFLQHGSVGNKASSFLGPILGILMLCYIELSYYL